jgi:hypothetical protein
MLKALDKWFLGYLASVLRRPRRSPRPRHLIVAICDHYEPFRDGADTATARQTVRDWLAAYPAAVAGFRDADGMPPRHTFFYPQEEYDAPILDDLAAFCRAGYGDVEIHLHHRHDTTDGLREKLIAFRDLLHGRHGLLGEKRSEVWGLKSSVSYAFIHGNWSLCNSRPDGDWCGVNEELGVLADTGCYADFTFPSAPSPTQPRMVNAIYYATDTPGRPRGADRGVRVRRRDPGPQTSDRGLKIKDIRPTSESENGWETQVSRSDVWGPRSGGSPPSSLLLVTGPLALNGRRRKWGLLPRLENAEISGANPPTADRVRLWARQGIGVAGRPDWVFVKLHTHGCVPANATTLLGPAIRAMHETLNREFNDGRRWRLHYVTAREMVNMVKAAEAGESGEPGQYRDYRIASP